VLLLLHSNKAKRYTMFNFNYAKYAKLYKIQLQQTAVHKKATTFVARAIARELLDETQLQLLQMQKSSKFNLQTALVIIAQLKAQHATA
jgi:hypothetical protein